MILLLRVHESESCITAPSHSLGSARGAAAVKAHSTAEIAATNWNFMIPCEHQTMDGIASEEGRVMRVR